MRIDPSGDVDWDALQVAAAAVGERAYAPYSGYRVGAAGLADDGRVVTGCNVENAAYGVVLCAECGVVSDLVASGGGRLLAVICVDAAGKPITPCGRCRQLLYEHGGEALVVLTPLGVRTLGELLPQAFGRANLGLA